MAFEARDNSGVLFRNDRKEKDSHPNARGTALIDGVEYEVAAWTKRDRKGDTFQSLSFKRKDGEREQPAPKPRQQSLYDRDDPRTSQRQQRELDDEIPF